MQNTDERRQPRLSSWGFMKSRLGGSNADTAQQSSITPALRPDPIWQNKKRQELQLANEEEYRKNLALRHRLLAPKPQSTQRPAPEKYLVLMPDPRQQLVLTLHPANAQQLQLFHGEKALDMRNSLRFNPQYQRLLELLKRSPELMKKLAVGQVNGKTLLLISEKDLALILKHLQNRGYTLHLNNVPLNTRPKASFFPAPTLVPKPTPQPTPTPRPAPTPFRGMNGPKPR